MNRFLVPAISFLAIALVSALVVQVSVRSEKLKPEAAVSSGQVIYSVDTATSGQAVVTGYKMPVAAPVADYGDTLEAATPLAAAKTVRLIATESARGRVFPSENRPLKSQSDDTLDINPYIIERLVKSSDKTYYFTEKSLTRSGVTVELLSMTPRKDDYFLKFRIVNASKDYFIPQAFAVRHGGDWVDLEKFFKHMLQGGDSEVGYLRVKASAGAKDKMFQLNESGGSFRKYSIFY